MESDDDEVLACPECDRTPVVTNAPGGRSHGSPENYRCARCGWKGDEPRRRPSRGDPDLRADSIAAKLDEADSLDELVTDGGVEKDDGEIDRCADGIERLSGKAACMENKAAIKKCRGKERSACRCCNRTWQESLTQTFARFAGNSRIVSRHGLFSVRARPKPSLSAGTANHGFVRTEGVPQWTGRRGRRVSRRGLYGAIQGRNERSGQPRFEPTSPRKLAGSILRRRVGFFSLIGGCSDLSVCSDTRRSAGGDGRAE